MQSLKIDVTKIDKPALYHGTKGIYLSLTLFENKSRTTDEYGNDGFIVQDLGKERRLAGEKSPIIGNWKHLGANIPQPTTADQVAAAEDDRIPF
jgi:hypothetical protein